MFLFVQDEPVVAPHVICLHVPAADRLQHEETHIQDALQGGRSGRRTRASESSHRLLFIRVVGLTLLFVAGETHFIYHWHLQVCRGESDQTAL